MIGSNAAALDINSESKPNYQIRTMDDGWLRQEATFKFDLDNIYGLDADKKVKLTVYGFGNATAGGIGAYSAPSNHPGCSPDPPLPDCPHPLYW